MGIRYRSVLEGVVDYVPHDSSLMEKGDAGAETIALVWRGVRAGEGSWRALFEGGSFERERGRPCQAMAAGGNVAAYRGTTHQGPTRQGRLAKGLLAKGLLANGLSAKGQLARGKQTGRPRS